MKASTHSHLYRRLPSVDELMREAAVSALIGREGHDAVTAAARLVLETLRREISAGNLDENAVDLAVSTLPAAIERQVMRDLRHSLTPVINATGVILHTNLGRAPLATAAVERIANVASGYSNLEFDTEAGERGKRDVHADRLFAKLLAIDTGGISSKERGSANERPSVATIVVNNNAAAVLVALNTLAEGGEVIVSRGELVEIGGSFRIPDVMSKSGAILREVGTTNRTRVSDYERAIGEKTRLLLRVHRSNFQISGFTEQPAIEELVALARKRNVPLMEDLGSGALFDLRSIGINDEPGVLDSLRAGVDVVTYSGDKLLGGPQAGILSGRSELVARIRSNPLFRALRVDKLTYAALEATLLAYVKGDHNAVPALRMMRMEKSEISARAESMAEKVRSARMLAELKDGESVIGGGAAPSAVLPTRLLTVACEGLSADELASRLRQSEPAIVARVEEGRVLLDLRTVFPNQDGIVVKCLQEIARTAGQ